MDIHFITRLPAATSATAPAKTVADGRTEPAAKPVPIAGSGAPRANPAEWESLVETFNSGQQRVHRSLRFDVERDDGRVVVNIVNSETQELIRRIPSGSARHLADAIRDGAGALLSETV